MSLLREHNLLAKARKYELFEMSTTFLGHMVSEKGIATDPTKLKRYVTYQHPRTKGG